ncbi:GAF and ANTAR domain-containing protein [Actinomadura barringtoniae]|uniref:GAF and ANTAR domain-containing protein n=1 Tax=Actinomadura barringtoniae TaxID=1427535 RepID=A0A939PLY8_9ACTN|nr:GAF and ANTAR domain-containing protein [Actinomadura barringtoniae]MBO2452478.1 GAF and ANTAR domain-containing protein [Actinomadura barringtoniae]
MAADQLSREQRLTIAFVDLADTLVDDFDIIDYLNRLAGHCADLLAVAAAGVLVTNNRGQLQLIAASTEQSRMLELLQLQQDEGPCVDTFTSGRAVSCPDLMAPAAVGRWPNFAPPAHEVGFRAAHGLPMRLRQDVIGTLNVFTHHPGELSPADQRLGQALADHATVGLLGHRATHQPDVLTQQLNIAVQSRIIIEQAKGVLAERRRLTVNRAAAEIRAFARRHRRKLSDVALGIIQDSEDTRELTTERSPLSPRKPGT